MDDVGFFNRADAEDCESQPPVRQSKPAVAATTLVCMHVGNCTGFLVSGKAKQGQNDNPPNGTVCLPYNEELEMTFEAGGFRPDNEILISSVDMASVLERVNVCEGRDPEPPDGRIKSGNGKFITISAPCTCNGTFGTTDLCHSLAPVQGAIDQCKLCTNVRSAARLASASIHTVSETRTRHSDTGACMHALPHRSGHARAITRQLRADGAACVQDLDTWIGDYLMRRECSATASHAAPIQAFCRAKKTQIECERVNDDCGDLCGGNKSELFEDLL